MWFVNDFAQYESAMRQGAAQSGWLIHDAFTAELHQPTLMFPLYVAIGKLAATIHAPANEQGIGPTAAYLLSRRPCRVIIETDARRNGRAGGPALAAAAPGTPA